MPFFRDTTIYIPYIHVLFYGYFGVGKDTLASKFPGDRLVFFLDGQGNQMPYYIGAKAIGPMETYELGTDAQGDKVLIEYQDITAGDGTLTRIEYFSSESANKPAVSTILETRMSMFAEEQDDWETLIVSSLSAVNLEAMYMEQYILNPLTKQGNEDPRQWRGGAADFLERLFFTQRSFRKCNVLFLAHTGLKDDGVTGEVLRKIALPGRLSTQGGNFFSEVWRLYVLVNAETGARERWLQLDNNGRYPAKTHLQTESPCAPEWDAIWAGWLTKMKDVHILGTKQNKVEGK